MKDDTVALFVIFTMFILSISGWLNHIVTCFQDDRWGFLVAGALFFPVAIIHGWGLWFGFW